MDTVPVAVLLNRTSLQTVARYIQYRTILPYSQSVVMHTEPILQNIEHLVILAVFQLRRQRYEQDSDENATAEPCETHTGNS